MNGYREPRWSAVIAAFCLWKCPADRATESAGPADSRSTAMVWWHESRSAWLGSHMFPPQPDTTWIVRQH